MKHTSYSVILIVNEYTYGTVLAAVESLYRQIYIPDEIILLDAISKNAELSIGVQSDILGFEGIKYRVLKPEATLRQTLNLLLSEAKSEYICFMEANEVWDEKKAANQISQLEHFPDISASCCDGCIYSADKTGDIGTRCLDRVGDAREQWIIHSPIKTCGQMMYRTKLLQEIGGFREELDELCDTDAAIRLDREKNIGFLHEYLFSSKAGKLSYRRRRKRFFEFISFLSRELYIDYLIQNKNLKFLFYKKAAMLALDAKMPIEFVEFAAITFLRSPVRTVKFLIKSLCMSFSDFVLETKKKNSYRSWTRKLMRSIVSGKSDSRPAKSNFKDNLFASREAINAAQRKHYGYNSAVLQENTMHLAVPQFKYMGSAFEGVLIIPAYVREIRKGAFAGCQRLQGVVFPPGLERIGDGAFLDCTSLEYISFSDNRVLEEIGAFAFAGCCKLAGITVPSCVGKIGKAAFAGDVSLDTANLCLSSGGGEARQFPLKVKTVESDCFAGCTRITNVDFSSGSMMRKIGSRAFFGCTALERVWIESKIETIDDAAFMNCGALEHMIISNMQSFRFIGTRAFKNCRALSSPVFSPLAGRIGASTYEGCDSLTTVRIPKTVKWIERKAFADCEGLQELHILNPFARTQGRICSGHTKVVYAGKADKGESKE